jgi:hypothetical protein
MFAKMAKLCHQHFIAIQKLFGEHSTMRVEGSVHIKD